MPLHLMNEQSMSTRSADASSLRSCETRLGSSRVPANRLPSANGVSGRSGFPPPDGSRGPNAQKPVWRRGEPSIAVGIGRVELA